MNVDLVHEIARRIVAVFGPLSLPRMLTVPTLLNVANISEESAILVNDITRISLGAGCHNREVSSEEMYLLSCTKNSGKQREEETTIITKSSKE